MLGLGVVSGLSQLALGGFLWLLLLAGVLQDADQWNAHREQTVAQISLTTIAGSAGFLATVVAFFQPRSNPPGTPWISVAGWLMAAVAAIVSVPLGWNYWLQFASNVWFFAITISSVIYVVVYLAMARFHHGRGVARKRSVSTPNRGRRPG